jgi:lipoprotein-anchoring transpeptidase ErfK/SrfK
VLRTILQRLYALGIPLLIGGVLWTQVSEKPPLATPPPENVINSFAATATTRPTATLAPTRSPMPSPTSTVTPTPVATTPAPMVPTPTPSDVPTPAPPVESLGSSETMPPLPAVVRLSADDRGRYILIDQATQTMHVFEGWREVRAFPVSTGVPDLQTRTPEWSGFVGRYVGSFRSFGTDQDDGWYLFSRGGDILLHGAPYTLDEGGRKSYLDLEALGQRPTSHGCIRLAPQDAAWITAWDPQGVPTTITAWPLGQPGRGSDYDDEAVG